jgi:hypothetical protein
MFLAIPTSSDSTPNPSTFSAEASRARTSALLARAPGSPGLARVFGQSTPASLASYDPATSSWRTSQLSLLADSESFSGTWPRSGMTRSGTAYQLQPLAPLTAGIGSGSWPTPTKTDAEKGYASPPGDANDRGRQTLCGAVNAWATPTAWLGRRNSHAKGDARRWHNPERSNELSDQVAATGTTGPLNPTWVEWLMGFPLNWTSLGE